MKFGQQSSKVHQLADIISREISMNKYKTGDVLPSINQMSALYNVSRDTVFKAFNELRHRGLIDAAQGKGYYVIDQLSRVLLLLDEYSPFKETLYNSFVGHLPNNYKVDLLFHQYNEEMFNNIILDSLGKYNKYVVMNFDNEKFCGILRKIPAKKLLLLDFGRFEKKRYSYICQNFDENFLSALKSLRNVLHKYKKMVLLFPPTLKHPEITKKYFLQFCKDENLGFEILERTGEAINVREGEVYIAIKQQDVVNVIKNGRKEYLICGRDYGLLAYNDIPSYEVIDNGITALTIDWKKMGIEAARFVSENVEVQFFLPTEVRMRYSI